MRALLIVGLMLATACSPRAAPETSAAQQSSLVEQRLVVMAIQHEPTSFAQRRPGSTTGVSDRSTTRLFNAGLLVQDGAYAFHPYLAENLPQLNTDTWRLFPDGSMETFYRLKPNLTWHDGQPLIASDFVFAWEVFDRPDSGFSGAVPFPQIAEVRAPDDRTVLIRWRVSYPAAGEVDDQSFTPLPRHILEVLFRDSAIDGLVNHPYWTAEMVGAGPYRLERWEPGSFVQGIAFEGHVLGRPKINRVQLRFIEDENTTLSAFLAGEVHATAHSTLRYEQVKALRSQGWSGTTVLIPIQPRYIHVQFRPEFVDPPALTDVRVRKALAYAIDKASLDESLFDGTGAITYSMTSPRAASYYADIDRAITKYPFAPRRSEELLNEAGFTRGADGAFLGADGQRLLLKVWTSTAFEFQRDLGAIAEGWQRAGIPSEQNFLAPSQNANNELRSTRPLISVAAGTADEAFATGFSTSRIPSPSNRWQGSNRGGWSNAEYDRLVDAYNSTLDETERNRRVVELERVVSEELPIIMLWYNFHVVAYASFISGPDTRGLRDLAVWNIHEWELR